ncbi:hypothetical protein [Ralstonia pseudosolanacearum]|uniref:hypothetical protein n=1 Tax=Ralstonia pseudosolanacearum TaxID=1310165 RepID=UPI003CEE252B
MVLPGGSEPGAWSVPISACPGHDDSSARHGELSGSVEDAGGQVGFPGAHRGARQGGQRRASNTQAAQPAKVAQPAPKQPFNGLFAKAAALLGGRKA